MTGPTLPPLPAAAELVREPLAREPVHAVTPVVAAQPAPVPQMRAPVPMPALALRPVPQPRSRNASCCWPIGEPGTKSFRFCDAEATHNKPYCSEHAQLAYVKVRDRRDEAAA